MTPNMSILDRSIRVLIAILIGVLYYFGFLEKTVAIVLGVIAVAFVITSFIGWCFLYKLFGIRTNKKS